MLLDNKSNANASVKGMFLFQRKGPKDAWEDTDTIPLSKLKTDEGYRLEIHSSELLMLHEALSGLYELHAQEGVPRGQGEFVRVTSRFAALAKIDPRALRLLLEADSKLGSQLLAQLLSWATDSTQAAAFVQHLITLPLGTLRTLNAAVNLQSLKAALSIWETGKANPREEFWQSELTKNSFLLEHIFAWPVMIVKEKAYVGGKSIQNADGKLVDFLMRNRVTRNAVLIEIKTPTALLLTPTPYRNKVFTPSSDLAGSVMQVLSYKHSLLRQYDSLMQNQTGELEAFDPRCAVIIGNAEQELQDKSQRESFELFRAQCSSVTIVTFDELFSRTEQLVALLEAAPSPQSSVPTIQPSRPADEDDMPF